ncbi:MAG: cysteine hydrolase, partial [Betaproteobacteria bacterium]|nr:cysteine hydrolase [Betaproteobacteria bacterium]
MPSIYLVLDMENDLIHEDGPNGKSPIGRQVQARAIVARTAEALKKARAAGIKVGYVRVGFSPDYRECPPSSPVFSLTKKNGLLKLGAWGTEIHPALAPAAEDFQIVKHRVSPFYSTNLEAILRAN